MKSPDQALIEAHIRAKGVTRCPTAALESRLAKISPEDAEIIRLHGEALYAAEHALDARSRASAKIGLAAAADAARRRSHHG